MIYDNINIDLQKYIYESKFDIQWFRQEEWPYLA